MQESRDFLLDTHIAISEEQISSLLFPLNPWERVYFTWDLWSGKSSFIRALLRKYFSQEDLIVRSPTYTYYQKYGENIYHFDLYRIESYEDLFLIGALDILENPQSICLIEWPEILGDTFHPTIKVSISLSPDWGRDYRIERIKN